MSYYDYAFDIKKYIIKASTFELILYKYILHIARPICDSNNIISYKKFLNI